MRRDGSKVDSAAIPAVARAGFTLLEMIVVITIMALIAGLVLARQPFHATGFNAESTIRSLVNGLRLARSRAIAQDRAVVVVTGANGFSVDGAAPMVLPAQETLSPARVVFTPDGGSTGDTILLAAAHRRVAFAVNWLTGAVRARELPAP